MTKFLDTETAAKKLEHLSPRTLEKWRLTGDGPTYYKLGRKVAYREQDLEAWVESRRRSSTSQ